MRRASVASSSRRWRWGDLPASIFRAFRRILALVSPPALIGASRVSQIESCVAALENLAFSQEALDAIEGILSALQ